MANLFLRSSDGADTDDGLSWANAKATLAGIDAVDAFGDTVFVADDFVQSATAALSFAPQATRIVAVDDTGNPASPTKLTKGPSISMTATSSQLIWTQEGYLYGFTFNVAGGGTPGLSVRPIASARLVQEDCTYNMNATSGNSRIQLTGPSDGNPSRNVIINPTFRFSHASQAITTGNGDVIIRGGKIEGVQPIAGGLFYLNRFSNSSLLIEGFDLSLLNGAIFAGGLNGPTPGNSPVVRGCKLHADTTLIASAITFVGGRAEMHNCYAGAVRRHLWIEDYAGTIRDSATVFRTGGATEFGTPLSYVMTGNVNASEVSPLTSQEFAIPLTENMVGIVKTLNLEIMHDSVTPLNDAEVWVTVSYPGNLNSPQVVFVDDAKADILSPVALQTASNAVWTAPGIANPNRQKLSVDITPSEIGYAIIKVSLALAGKTIYIDDPVLS